MKKKKTSNLKKIILGIVLILIVILVSKCTSNRAEKADVVSDDVVTTSESPIKTYTATLVGTGDALIHSPIYEAAYDSATDTYDFSSMLTDIKEAIKGYDIRYYNQEVVSDDDKPYSTYPMFNVPSQWDINMTADVGFNLVSLATNHSMDCGNDSAKKYAAWWESRRHVLATGMASTEQMRYKHDIAKVNGISYTMLSYTYGTNGLRVPEDYVVNVFDEEKALQDIQAVRDKVDVLIVAMHWGVEYNTGVTDEQKAQARFLGENGVDIILGCHPHCIEPWEWIDEDTVVFYSFGNFISNQMTARTSHVRKVAPIGMLGTLEITKTVDREHNTSEIKIGNIGAELLYTRRFYNNEKGKYDYAVVPFSKMKREYLSDYEDVYDEFSAILKKYDDNITIAPIPKEAA